jgi:NTP pyrophosphatase (non-canonical NTP hydrolase)
MHLTELQDLIRETFGQRDRARGIPANVAWLAEEVGELAQALRKGNREQQLQEFGDVLAWTATLANLADISLEEALGRYRTGCPRCGEIPCRCP